jgi:hypothetical protein
MPYIVTTKRQTGGLYMSGEHHRVVVSRRAVATLEEAHRLVWELLPGESVMAHDDWRAAFMLKAAIPESGGTVDPLPDGRVIQIEQVGWPDLCARVQTRIADPNPSQQAILNAFNAAETVNA